MKTLLIAAVFTLAIVVMTGEDVKSDQSTATQDVYASLRHL
jgi:hypothetical protein